MENKASAGWYTLKQKGFWKRSTKFLTLWNFSCGSRSASICWSCVAADVHKRAYTISTWWLWLLVDLHKRTSKLWRGSRQRLLRSQDSGIGGHVYCLCGPLLWSDAIPCRILCNSFSISLCVFFYLEICDYDRMSRWLSNRCSVFLTLISTNHRWTRLICINVIEEMNPNYAITLSINYSRVTSKKGSTRPFNLQFGSRNSPCISIRCRRSTWHARMLLI